MPRYPRYVWCKGYSFLNNAHYFLLKYGVGEGTKNRVEFYALWILMKTIVEKGVNILQVLGDSNILMDWENGKSQLTNLALDPIMEKTLEVKCSLKKSLLHTSTGNSTPKQTIFLKKLFYCRKDF
jgi:hypothetical protein